MDLTSPKTPFMVDWLDKFWFALGPTSTRLASPLRLQRKPISCDHNYVWRTHTKISPLIFVYHSNQTYFTYLIFGALMA